MKNIIAHKLTFILLLVIAIVNNISGQKIEMSDSSSKAMVVAAHPEAVKVGIEIIKKGGNAVDAAVAAAFMIGVVEPHASGLGGGGGMLIYLKNDKKLRYIDYYMKSSMTPDTNYSDDDKFTPRSICVPGTPAGLIKAHSLFGKLPLDSVIAPSIKMARNGFTVSEKFYSHILDKLEVMMLFPNTANLFFKGDFPIEVGDILVNEQLANVLENLATHGVEYFYKGEFAKKAVSEIRQMGGYLSEDDFANYSPIVKSPAHTEFRGFDIYSSPPPQSGVTMMEILNIFENHEIVKDTNKTWNAESIHLFSEASKRADIDRFLFLGDPATVDIPIDGLLSQKFANERFTDISMDSIKYKYGEEIKAGDPCKFNENINFDVYQNDIDDEGHTTHISIIDNDGNAVSVTQTLGLFFGSGFSSQGVVFNSAMSVFYKKPSPNYIYPGRRPLTTISPTIITRGDSIFSILGSPGGGRIFNVVAQIIIDLIDYEISPVLAITTPRFNVRMRSKYLSMESAFHQETINELKSLGYNIRLYDGLDSYFGGVQLIKYDDKIKKFIGVSDPRRDGGALGLD